MILSDEKNLALIRALEEIINSHKLTLKLLDQAKYSLESGDLARSRLFLSESTSIWIKCREKVYNRILKAFPELVKWLQVGKEKYPTWFSNN